MEKALRIMRLNRRHEKGKLGRVPPEEEQSVSPGNTCIPFRVFEDDETIQKPSVREPVESDGWFPYTCVGVDDLPSVVEVDGKYSSRSAWNSRPEHESHSRQIWNGPAHPAQESYFHQQRSNTSLFDEDTTVTTTTRESKRTKKRMMLSRLICRAHQAKDDLEPIGENVDKLFALQDEKREPDWEWDEDTASEASSWNGPKMATIPRSLMCQKKPATLYPEKEVARDDCSSLSYSTRRKTSFRRQTTVSREDPIPGSLTIPRSAFIPQLTTIKTPSSTSRAISRLAATSRSTPLERTQSRRSMKSDKSDTPSQKSNGNSILSQATRSLKSNGSKKNGLSIQDHRYPASFLDDLSPSYSVESGLESLSPESVFGGE
jgi:hypothetical protein